MPKAPVEHRITFGPFRTAHFREQVDAKFQRAFYSYLDRQIMPSLEGHIERIGGRVFSHYDQPEFNDLAETRHRYYFELSFHSDAGTEEAFGEVDFEPATETWTPSRIKPLRITTLSQKLREKRERELEYQVALEARHHQPTRPRKCPRCGSKRVAQIVYGLVLIDKKLEAKLKAGKVRLGGCFISDNNPQWSCVGCGHNWGLTARALARREILKNMEGQK